MIRLLITFGIQLLANALGLLAATLLLDDMQLTAEGFVIAVLIFTIAYILAQPFLTQLAMSKASALRGGVALVATLLALIVTSLISDGLSIDGAVTWISATVIVWIVSLLGVLLLPIVLVKKKVEAKEA